MATTRPMSSSILDGVLGMVSPEMKQAFASRLGESSTAVQSGLGTAVAATLGGLVSKAGDTSFLNQIIGLVSGSSGQSILSSLSTIGSSGPSGTVSDVVSRFLPMVFGGQQNQVTNLMTQRAGISSSAATSLLQSAVPLILGFLARFHSSGSLTTNSLSNMLTAEGPNLQKYLPTGFLSNLSGNFSNAGAGLKNLSVSAERAAETKAKGFNWMALLGVLVALLAVWFVYRALQGSRVDTKPVTDAASNAVNSAGNTANAAWASLGSFFKTKLPDGTELNIPQYGVENKLLAFIQGSKPVDDTTWFDFDRLLFDSGSATLQPASDEQLRNIAAIMKAYPNVKLKIGGYTDNTGDAAANLKLSQSRADNVRAELIQLGVAPDRLEAQGYGEEHPVADNNTEDGKQKNRRISMRVTAK